MACSKDFFFFAFWVYRHQSTWSLIHLWIKGWLCNHYLLMGNNQIRKALTFCTSVLTYAACSIIRLGSIISKASLVFRALLLVTIFLFYIFVFFFYPKIFHLANRGVSMKVHLDMRVNFFLFWKIPIWHLPPILFCLLQSIYWFKALFLSLSLFNIIFILRIFLKKIKSQKKNKHIDRKLKDIYFSHLNT